MKKVLGLRIKKTKHHKTKKQRLACYKTGMERVARFKSLLEKGADDPLQDIAEQKEATHLEVQQEL